MPYSWTNNDRAPNSCDILMFVFLRKAHRFLETNKHQTVTRLKLPTGNDYDEVNGKIETLYTEIRRVVVGGLWQLRNVFTLE